MLRQAAASATIPQSATRPVRYGKPSGMPVSRLVLRSMRQPIQRVTAASIAVARSSPRVQAVGNVVGEVPAVPAVEEGVHLFRSTPGSRAHGSEGGLPYRAGDDLGPKPGHGPEEAPPRVLSRKDRAGHAYSPGCVADAGISAAGTGRPSRGSAGSSRRPVWMVALRSDVLA